MSRIGKKPVLVPENVDVSISGNLVSIKGPKGELPVTVPAGLNVAVKDGMINVEIDAGSEGMKSRHGLLRMLIANSVQGVRNGFAKTLEIVGTGYKAELSGKNALKMSLGYSHPINFPLPEGINAKLEGRGTRLILEGTDKQVVGAVAAKIRDLRKPDSYKGKGVRFSDQNIRLKPGKSGAKK